MASLRFPVVCLLVAAIRIASVSPTLADETAPAATVSVVHPLTGPNEILALASHHRERWQEPKGNWAFLPDSLTGSGDSRIDFRGPFQPPFTLD